MILSRDDAYIRWLLYMCLTELDYVQSAEDHSQCASAKGSYLIKEGMKVLGVPDLSADTSDRFLKLAGIEIGAGQERVGGKQ